MKATLYDLMLKSWWFQKSAQSLLNTLVSFSSHNDCSIKRKIVVITTLQNLTAENCFEPTLTRSFWSKNQVLMKPWSRLTHSCWCLSTVSVFLLPLDGMLVHCRSFHRNLLGFPYNLQEPITSPFKCLRVENILMIMQIYIQLFISTLCFYSFAVENRKLIDQSTDLLSHLVINYLYRGARRLNYFTNKLTYAWHTFTASRDCVTIPIRVNPVIPVDHLISFTGLDLTARLSRKLLNGTKRDCVIKKETL